MEPILYNHVPRRPTNVSLWELVRYNYISETDIDMNGHVENSIYERACQQYIREIPRRRRFPISRIIPRTRNTRVMPTHISRTPHIRTTPPIRTTPTTTPPIRTTPTTTPPTRTTPPIRTTPHIRTPPPTTTNHINNIRLMKEAINENRKIQEKENCCMCLTNKVSYIFFPCYHVCSCESCAFRVDRCPKCRRNIENKHRVWF